jgi:cytochrome P450
VTANSIAASITLEELERDPHPLLARLREHEPVAWISALQGWLITRHDLALEVLRAPARFTVDDERFSTAQVVGPSMLSLDGAEHAEHRAPFVGPFRARAVRARFEDAVEHETNRLLAAIEPAGQAELRRSFAGPLAASVIATALGLSQADIPLVLDCYDAIVAGVTEITAGRGLPSETEVAFDALENRLADVLTAADDRSLLSAAAAGSALTKTQIISNAAVLLFGGVETTEGVITNAVLHVLERPQLLERLRREPGLVAGTIEESLRLEPAASVVDRYAVSTTILGNVEIAAGDLVRVSIAGANRDPAVFADPDRLDPGRPNARRHLAFAQGPHVCLGIHLARLEARTALAALLHRFPRLRVDPDRPAAIRGLVFRKPRELHVLWS